MQRANRDFLAAFQEVITDIMWIGSSRGDLSAEIRTNMWMIALSGEQCKDLTTSDLLALFERIVENRQQQLAQANVDHGMIFYLWFDELALQLRFNLISDVHERLPFGCQLNVLPTPEPILDRYLHSSFHESIPWSQLQEISQEQWGEEEKEHVLDVYQLKLSAHQPVTFW